jgi:hypothetical protein
MIFVIAKQNVATVCCLFSALALLSEEIIRFEPGRQIRKIAVMKLVGLFVEFCGAALVGFVVTLDVVNELKSEMLF